MILRFHATTAEFDGRLHTYELTNTDATIPPGEEIVNLKQAGQFRVSSLLSPQSRDLLNAIR